jgi:hypothetical protein
MTHGALRTLETQPQDLGIVVGQADGVRASGIQDLLRVRHDDRTAGVNNRVKKSGIERSKAPEDQLEGALIVQVALVDATFGAAAALDPDGAMLAFGAALPVCGR